MTGPAAGRGGRSGAGAGDTCAEFLERVGYLLDGELHESEVGEVRAHLDECAPCLHTYDLERTVKALVARSCAESAPEALRARVLFQIRSVTTVTVTESFTEGRRRPF